MRKALFLVIILLLYLPLVSLAQGVKNEVEESVHQHQMPKKAQELLAPLLKDARKVRFYRETDGQQVSYEAKLRWKGCRYSIEFHEDGSLMDIEKLVPYRSLPQVTRKQVEEYLQKEFSRFRIRKVQLQFSAEEASQTDADIIKALMGGDHKELTIRYEMEIDAGVGSTIGAYEVLFNANGHFLDRRTVIRRSLDNILY